MKNNMKFLGKREIPPVIAIQKKNLLMELDIVKTIDHLSKEQLPVTSDARDTSAHRNRYLEHDDREDSANFREDSREYDNVNDFNRPDFWESDFFRQSLESGLFLELDLHFFSTEILYYLGE